MGGLGRRMKHTAATCGIGVLALAGLPPFSGFWSKDAILHVAFHSENPMAKFGLAVGVLVAGLTAFYSVRMWLLAFWGTTRSEAAAEAHESPTAMLIPLWILSLAAAFLGFVLHQDERIARYLGSSATEVTNWSLMLTASAVAFLGAGLAWSLYAKPQLATDPMDRLPGRALLAGGWGVEGFWSAVGAKGSLAMGRMVAVFDRNVIDGAVNGIGSLHLRAGGFLRRTATGQTQKYALAMLTAIVLLAALLIWFESKGAPPEHIVSAPRAVRPLVPKG
jgi:NADH-quinone oxidoreductase subunit L